MHQYIMPVYKKIMEILKRPPPHPFGCYMLIDLTIIYNSKPFKNFNSFTLNKKT